jgi:hypothetical protein
MYFISGMEKILCFVFTSKKASIISNKSVSRNAVISLEVPVQVKRFSPLLVCSFESWLYRGGKQIKSEQGVSTIELAAFGVGDHVEHVPDTWGVRVGISATRHATIKSMELSAHLEPKE